MEYFTSDTHIGDERILTANDGRPFASLKEMHDTLLRNAWGVMGNDDVLYHLGDVAMGNIEETLKVMAEFPGKKYLIPGNHDKLFPRQNSEETIKNSMPIYEKAGFTILPIWHTITIGTQNGAEKLLLSHMPYKSRQTVGDKFWFAFPPNEGLYHLHGHFHSKTRVFSERPLDINVCVDANNWTPVPLSAIVDRIDSVQRPKLSQIEEYAV